MKKINIDSDVFEYEQTSIDSRYKLLKISANTISFLKDGKKVEGSYVRTGKSFLIDLNGVTLELSTGRSSRKSAGVVGDATKLLAPMPGKVFKVLKKKGEEVKAGEGVIVLEAMKMEHTLKALKDCTVGNILFAEGDQVTSGAELVQLEIQD